MSLYKRVIGIVLCGVSASYLLSAQAATTSPVICNLAESGASPNADPLKTAQALQTCIDSAGLGQTVALPAGEYRLQMSIYLKRSVVVQTSGAVDKGRCGDDRARPFRCAHLVAVSPLQNMRRAFIHVEGSSVTLNQIVIDGNKQARGFSPEAQACLDGQNGQGINLHVNGPDFKFLGSASINALCGSGLESTPVSLRLDIERAWVGYNGYHNQQSLWSDGITVLQSANATIRDNVLTNNTDVDLIFGGCTSCSITNNQIVHTDDFSQSSFAALMLHAWPNGSTSGDYTGTDVSSNNVNCGSFRCGFGLLLGAKPWYSAPTQGGFIHDNVINGAQAGIVLNDITGTVRVGSNPVTHSGGRFVTSRGKMDLPAFALSPQSASQVLFVDGADREPWQSLDFTGAIANWWQH